MGFRLNSNDSYPSIVRDGSIPYSKSNTSLLIPITGVNDGESYLVYVLENGALRRPAFFDLIYNGSNHVYVNNGILYVDMLDSAPRTGTLFWRIYNE